MTQLLHLPKTTVLGSPDILIGGIMQLTVDPYIFTLWSCNSRLFASKTRFNHQGQRVQQTSGWFCFQAPLTILQIYIHIIDLSIYIYIYIRTPLILRPPLKPQQIWFGFRFPSLPPDWLEVLSIQKSPRLEAVKSSNLQGGDFCNYRGPWKLTAKARSWKYRLKCKIYGCFQQYWYPQNHPFW